MSEHELSNIVAQAVARPTFSIADLIVDMERRKFPRGIIIRPGHRLLPTEDWAEAIVTVTGVRVRLVLLDARKPGSGAFTRLCAALAEFGHRPVVISPTREFAAMLARRGWRERIVGTTFETRERQWTPRMTKGGA